MINLSKMTGVLKAGIYDILGKQCKVHHKNLKTSVSKDMLQLMASTLVLKVIAIVATIPI